MVVHRAQTGVVHCTSPHHTPQTLSSPIQCVPHIHHTPHTLSLAIQYEHLNNPNSIPTILTCTVWTSTYTTLPTQDLTTNTLHRHWYIYLTQHIFFLSHIPYHTYATQNYRHITCTDTHHIPTLHTLYSTHSLCIHITPDTHQSHWHIHHTLLYCTHHTTHTTRYIYHTCTLHTTYKCPLEQCMTYTTQAT